MPFLKLLYSDFQTYLRIFIIRCASIRKFSQYQNHRDLKNPGMPLQKKKLLEFRVKFSEFSNEFTEFDMKIDVI